MQAINKIILGTVQFGLVYGINNTTGQLSQLEINQLLLKAYDSGIRTLDTAEAYGTSHDVIGSFHTAHPGKKFNVITKFPHIISESIEHKIDKYLSQIFTDRLEALLFHSYQSYQANLGMLPMLKKFKDEGKIQSLGVSIYTNEQMESVILDDQIDMIQLPFNLFDNINLRGDIISRANDKGKIIHSRSSFLQGLFFKTPESDLQVVEALKKELLYIRKLSVENDVSLQKMALNYCLQQKNIDNVLIGVDNIAQLQQNIEFANAEISDSLISQIEKIEINNTDLLNPSLWHQ